MDKTIFDRTYIITEVKDYDGNRKEEKIGRKGKFVGWCKQDDKIKLGMSLFFQYSDIEDKAMVSSEVKDVKYSVDKSGIVVCTENSIYTFSEVSE